MTLASKVSICDRRRKGVHANTGLLTDADDLFNLDAGSINLLGELAYGLVGVLVGEWVHVYPHSCVRVCVCVCVCVCKCVCGREKPSIFLESHSSCFSFYLSSIYLSTSPRLFFIFVCCILTSSSTHSLCHSTFSVFCARALFH